MLKMPFGCQSSFRCIKQIIITFIKLLIITTNPHFGEDFFERLGFGALRSADAENSIPGLNLTDCNLNCSIFQYKFDSRRFWRDYRTSETNFNIANSDCDLYTIFHNTGASRCFIFSVRQRGMAKE